MTTKYNQLVTMLARATESASPYVAVMKTTVEDSPWHREANVWVHTQMVVTQFLLIWSATGRLDDEHMFNAGVGCLFHDFGKPDAEEELTTPERGIYRRYKGHEAVSGAIFREVANSPTKWAELFGDVPNHLTPEDKLAITLMIQHHLPYQYKPKMVEEVIHTIATFADNSREPFMSMLRADSRGRISDDHDVKKANVEAWIAAAEKYAEENDTAVNMAELLDKANHKGVAYVLIGPSGAGKGTYIKDVLQAPRDAVFSMDDLRIELYGDPEDTNPLTHYNNAWKAAVEDETNFKIACTKAIHTLVKSEQKMVVGSDNMNLSKKARRQFIAAAHQAGRAVVGVVFISIPLEEVIARGAARGDRGIGPKVLTNMYHQMRVPAFDEVDLIHTV